MVIMDTLVTILFTVLLPPFCGVVVLVVILGSIGKTIGIRQGYVNILLKIFEVSSLTELPNT